MKTEREQLVSLNEFNYSSPELKVWLMGLYLAKFSEMTVDGRGTNAVPISKRKKALP